tara:strand:- start:12280 stop:12699 length:420 start_codon:yes stop_codon:yes gene_type:complete
MSVLEETIKEKINFLKKYKFEINYSKKERLLFITKDTMLIHGVQEMLVGSRDGDAESYNILIKDFAQNFKLEIDSKNSFGFKVGSRYIYFNLSHYLPMNVEQEEIDKIKTTICFFISLHINNILEYQNKKEKFKHLISV